FFLITIPPPPLSPLFPYTTLFRSDVSSPFYASALKGAQRALEQAGYRVMLMDSGQAADGEVESLRTLLAHRVDGLLVSTIGIERDRKSTRLNSSHVAISYAVFCLK